MVRRRGSAGRRPPAAGPFSGRATAAAAPTAPRAMSATMPTLGRCSAMTPTTIATIATTTPIPATSTALSFVPKVRIAKPFNHSGEASIAVLPTAITGLDVPPTKPAVRCPIPRATAADRNPIAPPTTAPGPARPFPGRPAAGIGSVDVLSATEVTVRATAPNVTRTAGASFPILWLAAWPARRIGDREDRCERDERTTHRCPGDGVRDGGRSRRHRAVLHGHPRRAVPVARTSRGAPVAIRGDRRSVPPARDHPGTGRWAGGRPEPVRRRWVPLLPGDEALATLDRRGGRTDARRGDRARGRDRHGAALVGHVDPHLRRPGGGRDPRRRWPGLLVRPELPRSSGADRAARQPGPRSA